MDQKNNRKSNIVLKRHNKSKKINNINKNNNKIKNKIINNILS